MTPEEFAQAVERAEKATAGPCEVLYDETDDGHRLAYGLQLPVPHTSRPDGNRRHDYQYTEVIEFTPETVEFFARARDDVLAMAALVEQLSAELDRRDQAEAEELVDQTRVESLRAENGQMHVTLIPPRELARRMFAAFLHMVGDAQNYVEYGASYEGQRFAFTVQRVGPDKLTPHQARERAEQRADLAEQEVARLLDQIEELRAQIGPPPTDEPPGAAQ